MNRDARRRGLLIFAAALVAMGIYWRPPFLHLRASGTGDWPWFHHMWEAGRVAILRWHEAPLWDPHHCGGASLWGNPQAQVLAPTYLLFALPFGTVIGHKLFLLLHALAGWAGMYLLARRLFKMSPGASAFTATVWCASGFFAWHGTGGHATYLAFYYAPLVLLAWRAAAQDLRWAAALAALMVLIMLEGGHYPFPFFVLWLGLDFVIRVFDRKAWKGIVIAAVVSGALTALLGALRFIPILYALRHYPRPVPDTDFLTLREIVYMLLRRKVGTWTFGAHQWVWPEYGTFVGETVLVLFVIGVLVAGVRLVGRWQATWLPRAPRRELVWLLVGLVAFLLLTQGNVDSYYPWPLLQRLKIYRSLHLPSRWRVMLVFYMALASGLALDAAAALLSRLFERLRVVRLAWVLSSLVPAAVAVVAVVDIYRVNHEVVDRWSGPPIGERAPESHFYLVQGRDYYGDFANYPAENVGTERCYDPVPWKVSPHLRMGRAPQVTIAPPSAGTVVDYGRTSLTTWAEVRLTAPATVTFNQNIAPGWKSGQGKVIDDGGLLAVSVTNPMPMTGRITSRYLPRDLPYTLATSALGALACILVARGSFRGTLRRRR